MNVVEPVSGRRLAQDVAAGDFDVGRGMARIGAGDLNRDGIEDLAIAGDSSRVYRLLGVGDGTFRQQPTITPTADTFAVDATDVEIADIQLDDSSDFSAPLVIDRIVTTSQVTATGRSGARVTSSPAGINVAVGSTGSAQFATGTAITLSATNGRDVIWSGACSSRGNKQRSCTFTMSGTSSVTANVQ